jgi:hypothetical protein
MPNKKRCPYCKDYNKEEDAVEINNRYFCNQECVVQYAIKNKPKGKKKLEREFKKETVRRKKALRESDLTIRRKAAVRSCHAYIRERDKNKGCITCGASLIGVKFDAGHFFKSTHSYTKFMEKNIHGQCVACNQYRGGEELKYREAIIAKYGIRTLKALEKCKHKKVKRTAQDYKKIEEYYKQKLKDLLQ